MVVEQWKPVPEGQPDLAAVALVGPVVLLVLGWEGEGRAWNTLHFICHFSLVLSLHY